LPDRPPNSIIQDTIVCAEMGALFMAGEGVKNAPSPTISC